MINKRAAYRVVRPTIDVSTVRAFAVCRLGELEGGVGADILDVVGGLRLIGVLQRKWLLPPADPDCEVLLVSVVLVLHLGHGGGLADGLTGIPPFSSNFYRTQKLLMNTVE